MAYSPHWWGRYGKQQAQMAALKATAARHRPELSEFMGQQKLIYIDLAPGRDVALPPEPCGYCWQQRVVYENGPLGLVPLPCPSCSPRNTAP